MMHNWGGKYQGLTTEKTEKKRGKPFAPYVTLSWRTRDKHGAVVPCCFVLGFDSQAVLGHLSENSLLDILSREKFEELRKAHRKIDLMTSTISKLRPTL